MSTTAEIQTASAAASRPDDPQRLAARAEALVAALRSTFGVEFFLFDGDDGRLLHRSEEQPAGDADFRGELARAVAQRSEPAFLGEEEPVLVLALPLPLEPGRIAVAVAAFVTRHARPEEDLADAARLLGLSPAKAARWIEQQEPWSGRQLNAVGRAVLQQLTAQEQNARLSREIEKVSHNLASTYEEISVLYGVTQHLQISSTDEELGRLALDWLREVIPAKGLAIQYLPTIQSADISHKHRRELALLTAGDCPLDLEGFSRLAAGLELDIRSGPVVINRGVTGKADWPFENIRQLIVVPLAQAENNFGWMAAFNHSADAEFGTVEASLMASVGAILGIHSGNIHLYRKQGEFLAQMVRALTSAIDAKDPYTCGHSDRVARISVRLGQALGCSVETLNKLYMGGLLHDIGKIGIDDQVLRKPGRLTPAEFEHIKLHPELGYNILKEVKQLEEVLPIVRHHHEAWDGSGYPDHLAGTDIPFLARICAVADAFDAMSSDRPYRKGMPDEKVDTIFNQGRGTQWDAEIVDAFFSIRDEIRQTCRQQRADLTLDVQQWI